MDGARVERKLSSVSLQDSSSEISDETKRDGPVRDKGGWFYDFVDEVDKDRECNNWLTECGHNINMEGKTRSDTMPLHEAVTPRTEEDALPSITFNQDQSIISAEVLDESTLLIMKRSRTITSYIEKTYSHTGTACSYTDSTRYLTSQEDVPDHEKRKASIMTDFQASMFLPSLQLSSISSVKKSKEHMERSMAHSSGRRSMLGSKSVMMSLVEKLSDDRGASVLLAIGNILPFLASSAVFSMPFAIAAGGYVFVVAILLVSLFADLTGILLADCLYEMSPRSKERKRVHLDYVDIAAHAWGKHGSRLIHSVQVFYLFSADIVNIVLLGKSFYAFLGGILQRDIPLSSTAITAIVSIIVLPTLFIQKLSYLAYLSLLSVVAIVGGLMAITIVSVRHHTLWITNVSKIPVFNADGFMLGLSIFFYTIIVHPVLPQIEGSMRDRARYNKSLHISFGFSALLKVFFGVIGAITFGPATKSLITLNVSKLSRPAGIASNLVLCLYAILAFPLDLFVVCEAFDAITLKEASTFGKGKSYHLLWIALTRPLLVGAGLGIALVVPYFGLLVGVLGSLLGTLLAFIFPCLLHIQLKRKTLSWLQIVFEVLLMIFGAAIGMIGLYAAVRGLVLAATGKSTGI